MHVQVKTLRASSTTFKMRLSAAERLAKELKPTFVYVLKVDSNLRVVDAFLLHFLNDRLASILKRLRQEEASGTPKDKINHKYISFTPWKSERVAPSGAALRSALETACPAMYDYANRKSRQLKELGYEHAPMTANVTFEAMATDDLIDAFLGLKQEISVSNFEAFNHRFGISLPLPGPPAGKISIEPYPSDECVITIRQDARSTPVVFHGEVFYPGIPVELVGKIKVLLKTQMFMLILEWGDQSSKFTISYDLEGDKKHPIEEWGKIWQMLRVFAKGIGSVRVEMKKKAIDLDLPISPSANCPPYEWCDRMMNLCESIRYVVQQAGVSPDPHVSLTDLENMKQDILFTAAFIKDERAGLSYETDAYEGWERAAEGSVILTKIFALGEVFIAYYGVTMLTADVSGNNSIRWTSLNLTLRSIRVLRSPNEPYDTFVKQAMKQENATYVIRYDSHGQVFMHDAASVQVGTDQIAGS